MGDSLQRANSIAIIRAEQVQSFVPDDGFVVILFIHEGQTQE